MSIFFIREDVGQKRFRRDVFVLFLAIALLLSGGYLSGRTGNVYYLICSIPVFSVLLALAVYRMYVDAKKWFVDINDFSIAFRTDYQKNNDKEMRARIVDWNDIAWIKKEQDKSISIYQQSSLMESISMKGFAGDVQEKISKEINEKALARGIRLVDF